MNKIASDLEKLKGLKVSSVEFNFLERSLGLVYVKDDYLREFYLKNVVSGYLNNACNSYIDGFIISEDIGVRFTNEIKEYRVNLKGKPIQLIVYLSNENEKGAIELLLICD